MCALFSCPLSRYHCAHARRWKGSYGDCERALDRRRNKSLRERHGRYEKRALFGRMPVCGSLQQAVKIREQIASLSRANIWGLFWCSEHRLGENFSPPRSLKWRHHPIQCLPERIQEWMRRNQHLLLVLKRKLACSKVDFRVPKNIVGIRKVKKGRSFVKHTDADRVFISVLNCVCNPHTLPSTLLKTKNTLKEAMVASKCFEYTDDRMLLEACKWAVFWDRK